MMKNPIRFEENVHLVELAAGRDNLLDAKLTQLGLELAQGLQQVILALGPELSGLNLSSRLRAHGKLAS